MRLRPSVLALLVLALAALPLAAAESVRRVELSRGKWHELTPDEWERWSTLVTKRIVAHKYVQRGGNTRPERQGYENREHGLDWEIRQLRLELRKAHQEPHPYYPDHHER